VNIHLESRFTVGQTDGQTDRQSWRSYYHHHHLGNNQLDAIFHVFIYLFHVCTCFERHSARHQEIKLY